MFRLRKTKPAWLVGFGVCLGLLVGLGMTIGAIVGMKASGGSGNAALDELRVRATSTHGAESFAIATGQIDGEAEGVFFLDYLTGDLNCYVINPRSGKFCAWFSTNVQKELPVDKSANRASYVMTTGEWTPYRSGVGAGQPAGCVVYVADANTGNFAAYSFPWQPSFKNLAAQASPMVTLDIGKARNIEKR